MDRTWDFLAKQSTLINYGCVLSKVIEQFPSEQTGRKTSVATVTVNRIKGPTLYNDIPLTIKDYMLLKPQNRFESNLAEMFIGWSYTRFVFLALIGNPTWLPGPNNSQF
jgi:hypothetical protein